MAGFGLRWCLLIAPYVSLKRLADKKILGIINGKTHKISSHDINSGKEISLHPPHLTTYGAGQRLATERFGLGKK